MRFSRQVLLKKRSEDIAFGHHTDHPVVFAGKYRQLIEAPCNHPGQGAHNGQIFSGVDHAFTHDITSFSGVKLMNPFLHFLKIIRGKEVFQQIPVVGIQKLQNVFFGDESDEVLFAVNHGERVDVFLKECFPQLPKRRFRTNDGYAGTHDGIYFHKKLLVRSGRVYGNQQKLSMKRKVNGSGAFAGTGVAAKL
ncbi:MAG: hypothetical protein UY10_C0011G0011 [Microgenomates group bacterium GW2011_GWA2_47_8]|nr:MAG: hypothetical protein UY10_C0011G0011 [Microgenomates group bacterium GW2011_GWA2_47_8]